MFLVNQKKKKANKSNKVFKSIWLKLLTIHAKCYWHFSNIFQFPYLHFVGNTSLPVFDIAFIGGCGACRLNWLCSAHKAKPVHKWMQPTGDIVFVGGAMAQLFSCHVIKSMSHLLLQQGGC